MHLKFSLSLTLFLALISYSFAQNNTADLILRNGRIIDGTGNSWFKSNIAISNGKIIAIGQLKDWSATRSIDVQNQIIAPGFIDVHAHTEDIFENPKAENFIRMGVTSLVTGNCGGSAVDVREFLGRFSKTPLAINLGTLIAHGSVRTQVLGLVNVQPKIGRAHV